MCHCSNACIQIGGLLRLAQLPALIKAIANADIGPDYDAGFSEDGDIFATIADAIDSGTPLFLAACEVAGGMFENLESVLREIGLTYSRCDDGHHAYPATWAFWEPGMAEPVNWMADSSQNEPGLAASIIRGHHAAGTLDAELDRMMKATAFEIPLETDRPLPERLGADDDKGPTEDETTGDKPPA